MADSEEFRFEILDLTPTTLSMRRLQDYLPHLVELFGSHDDVHLMRVAEGSAAPCIYAKPNVSRRVEQRLLSIKTGNGSRKAYRAFDSLNDLLIEDKTSAILTAPHFGVVIEFPGNKGSKESALGPICEAGELQGELFQVGGRDETISIHLRNEGKIFICTGTRQEGREISKYLFRPVRVHGEGRWIRDENGTWKLLNFTIRSFRALTEDGIGTTISALRDLGRALDVKSDMSFLTDEQ